MLINAIHTSVLGNLVEQTILSIDATLAMRSFAIATAGPGEPEGGSVFVHGVSRIIRGIAVLFALTLSLKGMLFILFGSWPICLHLLGADAFADSYVLPVACLAVGAGYLSLFFGSWMLKTQKHHFLRIPTQADAYSPRPASQEACLIALDPINGDASECRFGDLS